MNLYNTKTRTIEKFVPNNECEVTMYTCGPTVYHYAHIGNLRSYIMEDVLEKSLNYVGYNVKRCMNITDVGHLSSDSDSGEDKMLKGAMREHKSVMEIAKMYTDAFFDDCKSLNIKKPEIVVPATSEISTYIKIISKLLDTGFAYKASGNVYFDTSKLQDYYTLTNHQIDDMVVGVRESVEYDENKRNQADFVLWFTKSKFENQELKWDSPFGTGYPGWHIECSGISLKYLGEYLDIHCGGVDNIFPHHTNEIAQSESYLGHEWCHYWFHVEHLNDESGKMSKSKGEFLTVSLLKAKGYNPLAYRLLTLASHYRKQLVFSYDNLDSFQNTYDKLINKINIIRENISGEFDKDNFDLYNSKFIDALSNDLNTSSMLTVLYDVVKSDINSYTKIELIKNFDKVLGLDLLKSDNEFTNEEINLIESKIEERNKAKADKDYKRADEIRDELKEKGISILDTREGTKYRRI